MKRIPLLFVALTMPLMGCQMMNRILPHRSSEASVEFKGSHADRTILVLGQSNALEDLSPFGVSYVPSLEGISINEQPENPTTLVCARSSHVLHSVGWLSMAEGMCAYGNRSVNVVNISMGNTGVGDWATDWRNYGLIDRLNTALDNHTPDVVIYAQGETDTLISADLYAEKLMIVLNRIKAKAPNAIVYVSLCSYQSQGGPREGQAMVIASGAARQGVDIDAYRAQYGRDNGLHLTEQGYVAIGKAYATLLLNAGI